VAPRQAIGREAGGASAEGGDLVASRDEKTGETVSKRVVEAYVRDGVSTLALTLSTGEVITTTREHPFYVDGRGFVPAGRLAIGTAIVTCAGPAVRITGIRQGSLRGSTTCRSLAPTRTSSAPVAAG
jgi:hypothetical protein